MTRYNPEASDDRSIPLLLLQACHRGADDWSYQDALAVIANLLAERDDLAAMLAEAEQRGREEIAAWHDREAAGAMNSLHCGSENSEYRAANLLHDFHKASAAAIRARGQEQGGGE